MTAWRVEIAPPGTVPLADFEVEVIAYTHSDGQASALVEGDEAAVEALRAYPGVVSVEPAVHSRP